ncbi:MAG: response regulator transcription factor [Actinomycetota bacterium]|nr:response regulator transcription factor [Actinomycetota bacterium]
MHILIVEDEPRIASLLARGFSTHGYRTTVLDNGLDAIEAARDGAVDLVVLDIGLPGVDGLHVLEAVRRRGETMPVILLTARDAVPDRVAGLDRGADDYVTKPFAFDELLARVRARLRTPPPSAEGTRIRAGGLALDLVTRRASVDDKAVELTAREFLLAETLVRAAGQVLSREQLLSQVWGLDFDPGSNVVDVYVGYLRKKLGAGLIQTQRGVGHRITTTAQPTTVGPGGPPGGGGTRGTTRRW